MVIEPLFLVTLSQAILWLRKTHPVTILEHAWHGTLWHHSSHVTVALLSEFQPFYKNSLYAISDVYHLILYKLWHGLRGMDVTSYPSFMTLHYNYLDGYISDIKHVHTVVP